MAIVTTLENFKGALLQKDPLHGVYNFLQSCMDGQYDKKSFKTNKHIDLSNGIFAILQTYSLKPFKQAFFETHKKYIDFQLTIKHNECFMIGDCKNFTIQNSYDASKDLIVYKAQKCNKILSYPSCLCIFFPNDVHAGGLNDKAFQYKKVYKVVVKVPVEIIKISL
ncbi:YhcH/YjgK/YiaL family protein [Helicobacter didelphidarum]|uniref:YhcH/YjgK/YiaL family protein n=1 Tax=Helicobacter didelphidarum TaxID=2040648 RepID=A0A3D8IPS0_9HELI|nr:YhcH/YjgK/YiaL family protein [Helicobacter didelphidarum]RDU67093.1 YhcH/YjgK/YiaL family protein [Helicobacter didelphidarum]